MNRRLSGAMATILALSSFGFARTPATASSGLGVLTVWPAAGHSGDIIYLSGHGLLPLHQLTLVMACPTWFSPHVWEYENARLQPGPTTDGAGTFAGYRLQPFQLNVLPGSSCRIYTVTPNVFGPDIPAFYTILPRDQRLDPCDTHICARAKARPLRVRAGFAETIDILRGAPGARADISVSIAGVKAVTKTARLDSKGEQRVRVRMPSGITTTSRASIFVRCRLGPYRGTARAQVTIIR